VSLTEDIRTHLLTQVDVTNLASTRIYYDNLPQNATLPAIVIQQTNDDAEPARHLAGIDVLHRAYVSLFCYADTHSAAATLGQAVFAAMETENEVTHNTWGSTTVRRAFVDVMQDGTEAPRDGSDAWRHVRDCFAVVWYDGPVINSAVLTESGAGLGLEGGGALAFD